MDECPDCEDDTTWYYKKAKKTCETWVAEDPEKRCRDDKYYGTTKDAEEVSPFEACKATCENCDADSGDCDCDCSDEEEEIEELEEEIEELYHEVEDLLDENARLEGEVEELEDYAQDLVDAVDDLESQVQELERALEQVNYIAYADCGYSYSYGSYVDFYYGEDYGDNEIYEYGYLPYDYDDEDYYIYKFPEEYDYMCDVYDCHEACMQLDGDGEFKKCSKKDYGTCWEKGDYYCGAEFDDGLPEYDDYGFGFDYFEEEDEEED